MSVLDEDAWWSSLQGQEIENNLHGFPAYWAGRVAERILAAHPEPYRGLDIGCGIGRLSNEIARQNPILSVLGFDISGPSVHQAAANARANSHFWHSDGRTIPAGITGMFDLIWSVTVFQHIPLDAKWGYITQAAQRLHDDGVFVFTVSVGDEPQTFLNHQLSEAELEEFAAAMTDMFATVSVDGPDSNGWTWIEARK